MGWTLDELVRRAAKTLAAQGVRAPNGRVTALPDRRVVRWYSTIGLVDRPVAYRGRTALYGPRHLLQVVAVKRRQAQGYSLAEIQAELTGATDATLRAVAQVPVGGEAESVPETIQPAAQPDTSAASDASGTSRPRFWARSPVDSTAAPNRGSTFTGRSALAPAPESACATGPAPLDKQMEVSYSVALHPEVRLILRAQPDAGDLTEIRAAARPLLDLLSQLGLLSKGD